MDSTLVRHRVDIRWPKTRRAGAVAVAFLGTLLLLANLATAQSTYKYVRKHKEDYDLKPIHFGFYYALPSTRYNITYSDAFLDPATPAVRITSPSNAGFRVGFTINALLDDNFDLRTNPGVSIYSRSVKYVLPSGDEATDVRESTWVELPFLVKYKSARRVNSRMYLLAGASLGIETNVRRREALSQGRLNTSTTDLSLEYGVGFEQFFEYFKFAPELRFSHGIFNTFGGKGTSAASGGIQRLTTHNVTLYLNFE